MKRVKIVRAGCWSTIASIAGSTRSSHGAYQSVGCANIACTSTQIWAHDRPVGSLNTEANNIHREEGQTSTAGLGALFHSANVPVFGGDCDEAPKA